MRIPLATTIAFLALHATVNAGPKHACAQVSTLVDGAVRPLLANLAESQSDVTQLHAQFGACLSSRNICGVMYDARHGKEALIAGNVTADLPAQYLSGQDKSSVTLLVRSIPRVRNDSNQYCLVSEKKRGSASAQQWDIYGWVIAPNAREALPLQRQALEDTSVADPRSLRSLAAALWFFAERMSGQPSPSATSSEE
jgi:hypothetical protein